MTMERFNERWRKIRKRAISFRVRVVCEKSGSPQKGHGKRGGARVIYYHFVSASRIGLLFVYPKNEQVSLTPAQKVALRKIIEQWR